MKTIQYKDMGARIRAQRERLGYTREQLAEKLDVSTKFCSDIELGIKGISIQTLAKLSDLLCLRTDYNSLRRRAARTHRRTGNDGCTHPKVSA